MDREAFLADVRAAMAKDTIPAARVTERVSVTPALSPVDLAARFSEALEGVDGQVHLGDPMQALSEIVDLHGAGPFLSWDDEELCDPRAIRFLEEAGCARLDGVVPFDPGRRRSHLVRYAHVHIGLTGAEAAFAETGSIVLRSGAGRSRMASLVPLVHIALIPVDRVFRSSLHWLTETSASIASEANVVFVTGPSRTADIELQLTLGVHGPEHLHVIVV